jgi:hypothetical protein
VIGADSDIVGADPHGAIGLEQSSVQLLSSPEFDHLPMRIEYSIERRSGKVARLNGIFKRIYAEYAQYALMARLVQKEGKRLGVWIPRWWARVYMPSFRLGRHF